MSTPESKRAIVEKAPQAEVRRKRKIPFIWLVPVIAAVVAGIMMVNYFREIGPTITIRFDEGTGLDANHTFVRYRGVRVGSVRSIQLSEDAKSILVKVRLNQGAKVLAREDSLFWIVRPEPGTGWMRGLETIVAGSYIEVRPGTGKPAKSFVGLEKIPPDTTPEGGLLVVLTASSQNSISAGSAVYYREMEVGRVQKIALSRDAASVTVHAQIAPRFAPLVRRDTKFWNAGGLSVDLGFLGVKAKATSFKSLVMGGIAFATPPTSAPPATNGTEFILYDKVDDKWLKWIPQVLLPEEADPVVPKTVVPEGGPAVKPGE